MGANCICIRDNKPANGLHPGPLIREEDNILRLSAEIKALEAQIQSSHLGTQESIYTPLSTGEYKEMQGTFCQYLIEKYGEFDNSSPLLDSVEVTMRKAVRLPNGVVYKGQ